MGVGAEETVAKPGALLGVGIGIGIGFYEHHGKTELNFFSTPIPTPIPIGSEHYQRHINLTVLK
jgi:hypothetical protein